MKRQHQVLAGLVVVQMILIVIIFWPRPAVSRERVPIFADLSGEAVVALTITDGEGRAISLRRVGPQWVLPDAADYPAQGDKVDAFLEKVLGLNTSRLVTRTGASHGRLQVAADDFQRRVDLATAGGTTYRLYLGSSPRYGATHFRLEGQEETYLTDALSTWETSTAAATWIDPVFLRVPQDGVTGMMLENGNGTFRFVQDRGIWRMAGLGLDEELDETQLTGLLRRLEALQMVAPLGKEELASYGMDRPSAVVTLETVTGTISLRVGAQDPEDDSYVVIVSTLPYYVRVAGYNIQPFVERAREDFLLSPPTPLPEETASPGPAPE